MKEDTRRLRIEDIRKDRRIRGINTSAKEPQEEQHVRMRSGEHHDGLEKNKTKQAHCFGKTNSNRIKQADILTCSPPSHPCPSLCGGMKVQIRTQLTTSRKDRHLIDTSKGLYPTGPALEMAWVPRGTKAKL